MIDAKTIRHAWIDAALAEHDRTVDATTPEGEEIIAQPSPTINAARG